MKKLGWIGCGNMGRPMATNLLKNGYEVTVFDVVEENCQKLVQLGAHQAATPKEVVDRSDCFFTMLPNGRILESVVMQPETGIAAGLCPGKIFVDMSTIAPAESLRVCASVEAAGCGFLRAPVTGSTSLAESAALGVFSSGKRELYDQVLPLFQCMSNNQHYLGDGEQARVLKLAINLMVAANMQLLAECMTMVDKAKIDRAQAMEIIRASAAGSPVINYKTGNVVNRDYAAAFSVAMMEKDLDLALDAAKQFNVALPVTALTRQFLSAVHQQGNANQDFSYLVAFWESMHGVGDDDAG